MAFSRDGKWVAYTAVPDYTLWRSRVDGSERLQLTYPPAAATLPVGHPTGPKSLSSLLKSESRGRFFWFPRRAAPLTSYCRKTLVKLMLPGLPTARSLPLDASPWREYRNHRYSTGGYEDSPTLHLSGSKGLFSPRWSPDGRYLSATSVEGSNRLMLYDFRSQKWSEWLVAINNINYQYWSSDSRYVYYDNFAENPQCHRIKVGENHPEDLFSLSGIHRYFGIWGSWSGMAPDDSRIFVRDASTQDIYALDVDLP